MPVDNPGNARLSCAWLNPMDVGSHPLLRPDAVICARGDGTVQVGLAPATAVRAPDVAPVRALLAGLRDGAPAPLLSDLDPRAARCYLDLLDHHLVIDGDEYVAVVGRVGDHAAQQFLTADLIEHGSTEHHRARAGVRVGVETSGVTNVEAMLTVLLRQAGFTVVRRPLAEETDAETPVADLIVLFHAGLTPRPLGDQLLVDDIPHLVIDCVEGRMRVGPFVIPGKSACLRCVDAVRAEVDPRYPLVVEQYTRHRTPWPAAIPHDLLHIAVGSAVRDISRWADGIEPTTWSAVLDLGPDLAMARTAHPPHPRCGCTWDAIFQVAD